MQSKAQDVSGSGIRSSSNEEKDRNMLGSKWDAGIETLRQSHLKERGNPIYVLPWYVMLGRQGSGKSSSLRNCKVPMPLTGLPAQSEIAATQNFDWWFLESAVILDTAGRYCSSDKEAANDQEWQDFIKLLCNTRKDEPLNGIIVVVSVDDLKTRDLETLREDAKKIRRRVDSLMKASGMDFPVYLMVAKCDLIEGFSDYFASFSEKGQEQVLGFSNNRIEDRTDPVGFLRQGFDNVVERLRRLRLSVLLEMQEIGGRGGAFLFAEELDQLREPLTAFVESLFAENPYQNTPFFRSFFFVSSIQEGRPFSHFLKRLGFDEQIEFRQTTAKSLFLYDFYARVLKEDRGLSSLTRQTRDWVRNKTLAVLIGWAVFVLAFCILLTISFSRNISILNIAASDVKQPVAVSGEIRQALSWLDKEMRAIKEVYRQNRTSIVPRLGLNHSLTIEEEMRRAFINDFRSHLLLPLDKEIGRRIEAFIGGEVPVDDPRKAKLDSQKAVPESPAKTDLTSQSGSGIKVPRVADFRGKRDLVGQTAPKPTPPSPTPKSAAPEQTNIDSIGISRYIGLILDRIAILRHCIDDPDRNDLIDFSPQPDYRFMLSRILPETDNETAMIFGEEYRAYLMWQLGDTLLKGELEFQTDLLNRILSCKNIGLSWIIDWANNQGGKPITYLSYWKNNLDHIEGGNGKIDTAFTRKGWEDLIEPILSRMERLAKDPQGFENGRKEFEKTYWAQYQDQWKRFLLGFNVGEHIWKRLDNRIEVTPMILSSASPYARVLEDAVYELAPLRERVPSSKETVSWVSLFETYGRMQSPPYRDAYIAWLKEKAPEGKVPGFFSRAFSKAKGVAKSVSGVLELQEDELATLNLFVDFDEALQKIAVSISDPEKAVKAVRQAFEEARPTSASVNPVLKAEWSLERLKKMMGRGSLGEAPFWNLFNWPLRFGWRTELDIAGRSIQASWERDVLANVTDLKGWQKLAALLYNEKGEVWAFISGPLAPYLVKGTDGAYRPKELLKESIAFSPQFLQMLEGGRRSQQQLKASETGSLSVRLDAEPTDVNSDAEMKVHRTAVRLICGSEVQLLENFNYPVFATFVWKPDKCEELICEFDAGDASVEKRYDGFLAFPEFLRDISSGEKVFLVRDLVKSKGDISRHGVKNITIKFELHGHEPVLKFLEHVPEGIPKKIIMDSAL